jgi:hypothetical protein
MKKYSISKVLSKNIKTYYDFLEEQKNSQVFLIIKPQDDKKVIYLCTYLPNPVNIRETTKTISCEFVIHKIGKVKDNKFVLTDIGRDELISIERMWDRRIITFNFFRQMKKSDDDESDQIDQDKIYQKFITGSNKIISWKHIEPNYDLSDIFMNYFNYTYNNLIDKNEAKSVQENVVIKTIPAGTILYTYGSIKDWDLKKFDDNWTYVKSVSHLKVKMIESFIRNFYADECSTILPGKTNTDKSVKFKLCLSDNNTRYKYFYPCLQFVPLVFDVSNEYNICYAYRVKYDIQVACLKSGTGINSNYMLILM